jgi:hypothetical protein
MSLARFRKWGYIAVNVVPAGIVLIVFIWFYGQLMWNAWRGIELPSWTGHDTTSVIVAMFASLVTGVVSIGLGLKPSREKVNATNEFRKRKMPTRSLLGLGDAITPGRRPPYGVRTFIALAYIGVYVLVGAGGLVTWWNLAIQGKTAPDVLVDFEKLFFAVLAAVIYAAIKDPENFSPNS